VRSKSSRIAVLAWGSLVWDRRELAIAEEFSPSGPHLPVEFCRISRGGRLTIVIDEALGASCETYVAPSAFGDLDEALRNLWIREGSGDEQPPGNVRAHGRVGWIDMSSGTRSDKAVKRHPRTVDVIAEWSQANGYDAVIWTALANNFREPGKAAEPFSVDAAIRHLERLESSSLDAALRYVRSAPFAVQTPVRSAVTARWPEG